MSSFQFLYDELADILIVMNSSIETQKHLLLRKLNASSPGRRMRWQPHPAL
jgi:hypothetical protein